MHVIYALENLPNPCRSSLFLGGASPRRSGWREEALRVIAGSGYGGTVIVPESRAGTTIRSSVNQASWEAEMRSRADMIAFWVPRHTESRSLASAQFDFGKDYDSCRCLYGREAGAPGSSSLDTHWQNVTGQSPHQTLADLLAECVSLIGEGSERHGAERDVPLAIWRSQPFASWYSALIRAGHVLQSFELRYAIPYGKRYPTSQLFGFLAWAAVAVAGENRVKANELFLARPDTAAILPLFSAGPESEVFLVREYRLPVNNPSGFVVEVSGGSSKDENLPIRAIAMEELANEMGIKVTPSRLVDVGSRQSAPTLCSHHTHLFALALTTREASHLRRLAANHGVLGADREERITIVRQPLAEPFDPSLDWASIGLINAALKALSV